MNYTPEQDAAITAPINADQAIVALAGSGKTTVAAERIKHLIDGEKINPSDIIALTFTKAGGVQLQRKIPHTLRYAGTLHAFAMRTMGIDPSLVLSEAEESEFLRAILLDAGIKTVNLHQFKAALTSPLTPIGDVGLLYRTARARLDSAGKTTFDLILQEFYTLLRAGEFLDGRRNFIVVVDEAQDTSPIDAAIFQELAHGSSLEPGEPGMLIAIGDPNQAIYGFRGATPKFLNKVMRRGTKTPLTKSFRCCREICEAASKLLAGDQCLESGTGQSGMVIGIATASEREMESKLLDIAATATLAGHSVAILCRYNAGVDHLRRVFAGASLPVKPRIGGGQATTQAADMARFFRAFLSGDEARLIAAHPLQANFVQRWPSIREFYIRANMEANTQGILRMACVPSAWLEHGAAHTVTPEQALEALVLGDSAPTDDSTGIHIETIHGAKGREWDHVVLAYADTTMDPDPDMQARNLVYVAATRARYGFTAAYSTRRVTRDGSTADVLPSRIVSDLLGAEGAE